MKKNTLLLTILLGLFSIWQSKAQDANCGTVLNLTESQKQQVLETMRTDFVEFHTNRSPQLVPIVVPVQIHIVQTTAGTGGISEAAVLNEISSYVNPKYAGVDMTFATIGPTNYINSDGFYSLESQAEGTAMSFIYNVPNVLNLYFVAYAAGSCGWSRFTSHLPQDYIVMNNGCATNTSTLAHEIGHYFDLYHTHETSFGNELVNGTNCGVAGDLFCDTPADPVLSNSVNSSCFYYGTGTDSNGQAYTPDTRQIMSYSQKHCRINFTPEAESKILFTAANARNYIFNGPIAIANPIAVSLDGTGNITITGESLDGGSIGTGLSFDVSPSAFTCIDLGENTVTLTVTDSNGTTASTTTIVTVIDSVPVSVICQNPTVSLDSTGSATITTASLDGGSTAGICGFDSMYMTSGLTTSNLDAGFNFTTFANGNMFEIIAVNEITIDSFNVHSNEDLGVLMDFEVYFKTGSWIGSETNAGDWTLVGSVTDVPSAGPDVGTPLSLNLGINVERGDSIAFYVTTTDGSNIRYTNSGGSVGDISASDANLQLLKGAGNEYPFLNTWRPRGFNGNIIYEFSSIFDGNFDCSDVGSKSITLNVIDNGGNLYSCEATVTVVDGITTVPMAFCQDITLPLDAMGNGNLTPSVVDNGASDCGGLAFLAFETMSFEGEVTGTSPTDDLNGSLFPYEGSAFTVPVSGNYTFNMTGTTTTGGAFIIIWDDTPIPNSGQFNTRPEFFDFAVWVDAGVLIEGTGVFSLIAGKTYYMTRAAVSAGTGVFNTSVDMPIRTTAASTVFTCANEGDVVNETLYVFDPDGNTSSCTTTVTIDTDLTAPTALCTSPTILLDAMGNTILTPSLLDGGSTVGCGAPFLAFETLSFDGEVTGANPTDNLNGSSFPYEGSTFIVPVSGDYTFNMTGTTTTNGVFIIIWDDTPIPNSGQFNTRPEFFDLAVWDDVGVLLEGSGVFSFVDGKTYYMTRAAISAGTGIFNTSIDMPIRTTAASTAFTCANDGDVVNETLYAFDTAGNVDSCVSNVTVDVLTPSPCSINVSIKAYLQGPYMIPVMAGLMNDDLRPILPDTSPYPDDLTCSPSVFTTDGNDAIVDWVWVELRDADNRSNVIESRSALLQRDGDIVDVDGTSAVAFTSAPGSYYVLVDHRNHIGILSEAPIAFGGISIVNLSSNPAAIFGGATAVADMGGGVYALFSGDYDGNGQVQSSDGAAVVQLLGGPGYTEADMDMNGQIQVQDLNNIIIPNTGKGVQYE